MSRRILAAELSLMLFLAILGGVERGLSVHLALSEGVLRQGAPMRVLILYDDRSEDSVIFMRYILWLLNVMWRIPVDIIDTSDVKLSKEIFFEGDSKPRYAMVFLGNIIDGEYRLSKSEWILIRDRLNGKVPIVTCLYAVQIEEAAEIFGCEAPKPKDVRTAQVELDPITEAVPRMLHVGQEAIISQIRDGDALIWDSSVEPRSGALLVRKGINVWFGFRDFLGGPPSNGPLTMVFRSLLRLIPQGFVRLKIPYTLIALRIDDVPYTTESWFHGWEYFSAEEWLEFFKTLKRHGAKCDLLIVPYNVSKETGQLVPYNVTHGDVLEAIREGIEMGVVEVGCHGATHVNPNLKYFMEAETREPWKLTSTIRFEFGYDPHTGERIPKEFQEHHLRLSTETLEDWFGFKPKLFTPPWHVWDSVTESILEDLGYKFISADFRLYTDGVRPPSIMGEKSLVSSLFAVPMTHDWDGLEPNPDVISAVLKPHIEAGIPIVFLSHGRNWSFPGWSIDFTISENEARLNILDDLYSPRYAKITEIGEFLINWSSISFEAHMDGNMISMNITSPFKFKVRIEAGRAGYEIAEAIYNGLSLEVEGDGFTVDLAEGTGLLTIKLQKAEAVEEAEVQPPNLYLYGSAIALAAITLTVIVILERKRQKLSSSTVNQTAFSRIMIGSFQEPSF